MAAAETVQIEKAYLQRLVDLADNVYAYDNSEANQLKGFIEALRIMYSLEPSKKDEVKK